MPVLSFGDHLLFSSLQARTLTNGFVKLWLIYLMTVTVVTTETNMQNTCQDGLNHKAHHLPGQDTVYRRIVNTPATTKLAIEEGNKQSQRFAFFSASQKTLKINLIR